MKKRTVIQAPTHVFDTPLPWLPIDSRLFPFIGFGKVRGVARIFLTIEIAIAISSVVLSLILLLVHMMGLNPLL